MGFVAIADLLHNYMLYIMIVGGAKGGTLAHGGGVWCARCERDWRPGHPSCVLQPRDCQW